MPSARSGFLHYDVGPKMDITAEIANGDVVITTIPIPYACTLVKVMACADVLPTAGTFALQKAVGAVDVAVLAASLNLATGLTANVGASLTISTVPTALHFNAGDMLRATWTFTTIGSGEGFGAIAVLEPDET